MLLAPPDRLLAPLGVPLIVVVSSRNVPLSRHQTSFENKINPRTWYEASFDDE